MVVKTPINSEQTYERFIGTTQESDTLQVPTVTSGSDPWKITVSLYTQPIEFHIDTGGRHDSNHREIVQETQFPTVTEMYQVFSRLK